MTLAGKAVMINWSDVAVQNRARYYDWHDREHIAGRVKIPGFLRGRRHLAIDADRDIFNLYEVQTLQVLTGDPYVSMTNNPSDATKEIGKFITHAVRALAHVRFSSGMGVGAFVQTVRFDAKDDESALSDYLIDDALPALAAMPDIVGVHLCVADKDASSVVSSERKGRPTSIPNWSVIVEGTSVQAVRQAVEARLSKESLMKHDAGALYATGTYGLQIVMSSEDVKR